MAPQQQVHGSNSSAANQSSSNPDSLHADSASAREPREDGPACTDGLSAGGTNPDITPGSAQGDLQNFEDAENNPLGCLDGDLGIYPDDDLGMTFDPYTRSAWTPVEEAAVCVCSLFGRLSPDRIAALLNNGLGSQVSGWEVETLINGLSTTEGGEWDRWRSKTLEHEEVQVVLRASGVRF